MYLSLCDSNSILEQLTNGLYPMFSNVLGNTIFLIPLQFQNEFLQILLTSFRTRQSVSIEFKHPITDE